MRGESLTEIVEHGWVDVDSRTGRARLALIGERGQSGDRDDRLKVGVRPNDLRVLATELKGQLRQVFTGGDSDLPADGGCPGERDLVDEWMRGQSRPCHGTATWNDVQHSRRHSGLEGELTQSEGSERSFGGWLQHDRVARGERWRNLPHSDHRGCVPRSDCTHHTQWFVSGV